MIYRNFSALAAALLAVSVVTAKPLQLTGPNGETVSAATPMAEYGPTQRTDTLWRIANRVRPDQDVTIYQVMVALFQANPDAFASTNFNSLEKNHILKVPGKEVMLRVPPEEARQRARQDDRNWGGKPAAPAQTVVKPVAQSGPTAAQQAQLAELQAQNQALRTQLAAQPEVDSAELELLRDELSNSVDQLATMLEENELLKRRLESMGAELALLQATLDEQQSLNQSLMRQLETPAEPAPAVVIEEPAVVETPAPSSFWQDLLKQPLLLTLFAVVPALAVVLGLFFWLRRRQPDIEEKGIAPVSVSQPGPIAPLASGPQAREYAKGDEANAVEDDDGLSLQELLQAQEVAEKADEPTLPDDVAAPSETQAPAAPESQGETLTYEDVEPEPMSLQPEPILESPEDHFIDIDKLLEESHGDDVEVPYPGVSLEGTPPPMAELLEDESTVNAKLDLARAYLEIEDKDSARALLKEVDQDGSPQQQQEARQLLDQL